MKTLLERIADMAACVEGNVEEVLLDAAKEIKRLQAKIEAAHRDYNALEGYYTELAEKLAAANRAVDEAYQRGYATGQEEIEKERDALRARVEQMGQQKPDVWMQSTHLSSFKNRLCGSQSSYVHCSDHQLHPDFKPLYALPGAKGEEK